MRLLFLLLTAVIALPAQAQRLRDSVVKVVSRTSDHSMVFRGSGLAFQKSAVGYVVTSDHVVLHDNNGKRHIISSDVIAEAECEYILSDYGKGLALLRVLPGPKLDNWPTLERLQPAAATLNEPVVMMGFPAMADGLIRDTGGTVREVEKSSSALIEIQTVIEIQNGHAEFGMSGGVVATPADEFLGILSHQVYSDSGGSINNKIHVLPGRQVKEWIEGYFADPNSPPVTLMQTTPQLIWRDSPTFSSHLLNFSYVDAFATGKKVVTVTSLDKPVSRIYAESTGNLQKFEQAFARCPHCVIYLHGFRRRGPLPEPRGSSASGIVGELRALGDPGLEPVFEVWGEN